MEAQSKPAANSKLSANAKTAGKNSPTTEKASEAAHVAVDKVAEKAAVAETRLRQTVNSGAEQLQEKKEEAKQGTEDVIAQVRGYTQENPLAAAGIAFAAGLIVSRLLRQ